LKLFCDSLEKKMRTGRPDGLIKMIARGGIEKVGMRDE